MGGSIKNVLRTSDARIPLHCLVIVLALSFLLFYRGSHFPPSLIFECLRTERQTTANDAFQLFLKLAEKWMGEENFVHKEQGRDEMHELQDISYHISMVG